jgi:hypothetical protein
LLADLSSLVSVAVSVEFSIAFAWLRNAAWMVSRGIRIDRRFSRYPAFWCVVVQERSNGS